MQIGPCPPTAPARSPDRAASTYSGKLNLHAPIPDGIPAKARLRKDAGAERDTGAERQESIRGPEALGDPVALRLPARDGGGAGQLGDSERTHTQPRRAEAGRPRRGSPGGLL